MVESPKQVRGKRAAIKRIAPRGVNVYNPVFDVTEAELIKAIITEKRTSQLVKE